MPRLTRLTQHLPPGWDRRQVVQPKCAAPTHSPQTQTLPNFPESEELKGKIVQSITMCNFNARHNGSSCVGGYYLIINLNQMPKDFCHPQRPFHQALQEVFQWKKNSPLPSLQAWEGCTAFLTVSNEIPYYCFSPGRLQKSCKLHRAHMSINLKQKTSKEINCSSPISIWHSLPFFGEVNLSAFETVLIN